MQRTAVGCDRIGLLLAVALGVAGLTARPTVLAQAPAPLAADAVTQEVVISATRQADETITARVEQALQEDRYLFSAHMNVVTRNGVVRVQGIAFDQADLTRALMLARQASGGRRVLNEVELVVTEDQHD